MKSKRTIFAAILSLAAIALVGCGGGSTGGPLVPNSPFVGSYVGAYTSSGSNQSGTMTAAITATGQITGSIANPTVTTPGTVNGSVDNYGHMDLAIFYPGNLYEVSGIAAFAANGHLTGNLDVMNGPTVTATVTMDLTKQ